MIRIGMTRIHFIYMCPDYIFTFVKQDIYMIAYQEPFFRCSVVACRLSDKFTISQHLCRNPLIHARPGMLQIVTKQKRGNHIVSRKIRNDFYCFTVHFFFFSHFVALQIFPKFRLFYTLNNRRIAAFSIQFFKIRNRHFFAAFHGRKVCTDTGCSPVSAFYVINEWLSVLHDRHDKLVDHMWM